MSVLNTPPELPRHTVLRFSPWFIVGSALILGLAIAFWAAKNARLERENLSRNLLERAGALMWAMEGSARVGMGFRSAAAHLQFMLEETAKQPGIVYMAIVTQQGHILAHSEPGRIGEELYPPQYMVDVTPSGMIRWRIVRSPQSSRVFEAYKIFAPLPGFREHMGHGMKRRRGKHHIRQQEMIRDERGATISRGEDSFSSEGPAGDRPIIMDDGAFLPNTTSPEEKHPSTHVDENTPEVMQDSIESSKKRNGLLEFSDNRGAWKKNKRTPRPFGPGEDRKELVIVIGMDMKPFDDALAADLRNTVFTAVLVGFLGLGGFMSLFWAQNYRFSRRLLLDTRALADRVVSSLPLGLLILDPSGRVAQANESAQRLFARSEQSLAGRTVDALGIHDCAQMLARLESATSPVIEEEHMIRLPTPDHAEKEGDPNPVLPQSSSALKDIPVSVIASRILNDQGESLGSILLLRDLSEVKRLQAELRRSERMSTLGNMAARVAHEIRNPLSSIKGFATYLGSRSGDKKDAEAAKTMIGEVDRLNRVVSELLDFARPSNLHISAVDLGEIVSQAMRLVTVDAQAKTISMTMTSEPQVHEPVLVAVDAERVAQALLNLLINAVQATENGGSLIVTICTPEAGQAVLSLQDSGKGIPSDVLSCIFNPYFTTKTSGTGLGLSIVAKIVEDHGGDIEVDSEVGQGTTVTLRLPLAEHPQ